MSSANKGNFTPFFALYFSLPTLVGTTSKILYRSAESGHPFLPYLKWKASSLSPLSIMLAIDLS